jgi:ABC-2 type transport system ATP-binding protein
VKDLGLELRQGEIYGFLGRNGAGKTTTLKLLCGLLTPHEGTIELAGKSLRKVRAADRKVLGYVSQEQSFYPWMNARQLGRFVAGFYPSFQQQTFEALLTRLDIPADRKSIELSGGTRTKLGIALALAHSPAVLLLDEPTAGLDPVMRHEVLSLLSDRAALGQTLLFSSHLVSELEPLAQRIGILHAGHLEFQGPLPELIAAVRTVRALTLPPLESPARVLREDPAADGATDFTVLAPPEAWDGPVLGPLGPRRLTLSDIFLAFARRPTAPAAAP